MLLLEADVYRPTLSRKLGLKPWPGLTEAFKFGTDPMHAIDELSRWVFIYCLLVNPSKMVAPHSSRTLLRH